MGFTRTSPNDCLSTPTRYCICNTSPHFRVAGTLLDGHYRIKILLKPPHPAATSETLGGYALRSRSVVCIRAGSFRLSYKTTPRCHRTLGGLPDPPPHADRTLYRRRTVIAGRDSRTVPVVCRESPTPVPKRLKNRSARRPSIIAGFTVASVRKSVTRHGRHVLDFHTFSRRKLAAVIRANSPRKRDVFDENPYAPNSRVVENLFILRAPRTEQLSRLFFFFFYVDNCFFFFYVASRDTALDRWICLYTPL